uniref:Uncharacterized protein n=1 Tax=uncultured bacterium A1Q1_fos_504 TaxID=1256580 RepID=L7VWI7_9BACT|nr:hypothetical protein [uncultured bacterium A1Q1_fos_504]
MIRSAFLTQRPPRRRWVCKKRKVDFRKKSVTLTVRPSFDQKCC